MFEQLFQSSHAIARHRQGPLAEERLRYLMYLADRGIGRSTLRGIADRSLRIALQMNLTTKASLSVDQIDAEANRWSRRKSGHRRSVRGATELFKATAMAWFRFLGWLRIPTPASLHADLIADFAKPMEQERGLSPSTISRRCWFVNKFFDRLRPYGCALSTVRIRQIEEVLAWQGNHGYSRTSIRTYADSLRAFFCYAERRGWCARGIADSITAPRIYRDERLPSGPPGRT